MSFYSPDLSAKEYSSLIFIIIFFENVKKMQLYSLF